MLEISKSIKRGLVIAVLALSLPAWAQGALTSEMQAWLVTTQADGPESFAPANSVEPGQVIEYRTIYTNAGASTISGLTVVGLVPAGTVYIGGSATTPVGHVFEASVDGGSKAKRALVTVLSPKEHRPEPQGRAG